MTNTPNTTAAPATGWPKGKPRGPQNPAHKANRVAANSAGQRRRFADPEARQIMSQAMSDCWRSGARSHEHIQAGDRHIHVGISQEDWDYLHFLSNACKEPLAAIVRDAITSSRIASERDIEAEGMVPGWKNGHDC